MTNAQYMRKSDNFLNCCKLCMSVKGKLLEKEIPLFGGTLRSIRTLRKVGISMRPSSSNSLTSLLGSSSLSEDALLALRGHDNSSCSKYTLEGNFKDYFKYGNFSSWFWFNIAGKLQTLFACKMDQFITKQPMPKILSRYIYYIGIHV